MAISIPANSRKFRAAVTPMFIFIFVPCWLGLFASILIRHGWDVDPPAIAIASALLVVYSLAVVWILSSLFPLPFPPMVSMVIPLAGCGVLSVGMR